MFMLDDVGFEGLEKDSGVEVFPRFEGFLGGCVGVWWCEVVYDMCFRADQ